MSNLFGAARRNAREGFDVGVHMNREVVHGVSPSICDAHNRTRGVRDTHFCLARSSTRRYGSRTLALGNAQSLCAA